MKQIRSYIGIVAWLLTLLLAACTDSMVDSSVASQDEAGTYPAHFTISVPSYSKVESRVANFANEGIENADAMKLMCFDADGYFLGLAKELKIDAVTSNDIKENGGTDTKNITANIPGGTARIHLLANVTKENTVNSEDSSAIDFEKYAEWVGRHENNLITSFENKNINQQHAKMVYWGYVKKSSAAEMKTYLTADKVENNVIHLLRNRAKIEVENKCSDIKSIRYAIGNVMTFGTVAPFDRSTQTFQETNLLTDAAAWKSACSYTTPSYSQERWPSDGKFSTGDEEMWPNNNNLPMQYTFEQDNTTEQPLKVIMKVTYNDDSTPKWFQVLIQNDGKQLPIKRNHLYKITIERLGKNLGYTSDQLAYNGTPANNPWIKVEDIIENISDGTYTMDITDGTYLILTKEADNSTQTINFTYTGDDTMTSESFDVSWTANKDFTALENLEDGTKQLPAPTVTYDNNTHMGTITYKVGNIEDNIKNATIKLVDKNHGLTRNIHLYSVTNMDFKFPSEVTLSTNTTDTINGELKFTIPAGYPEELLPIEIEIASNDVNSLDSDVKVASTSDVDDGGKWNCWFVTKYIDKDAIGKEQTIQLKNVRTVSTSYNGGKLYIKAKYYDGGYANDSGTNTKAKKVTIKYQ